MLADVLGSARQGAADGLEGSGGEGGPQLGSSAGGKGMWPELRKEAARQTTAQAWEAPQPRQRFAARI